MSGSDEPIHVRLADLVAPFGRCRAVDLGCGSGPTLRAVSRVSPDAVLLGIDRSDEALRQVATALEDHRGPVAAIAADLRDPLPIANRWADVILSYNTLECVPTPETLLAEVARVLRPGGRAVIAHVDFDSLVIAGADSELDRRICHAFADDVQSWMDHADGRIGRKLGLLLARSPLEVVRVEPFLVWSSEFTGHARRRIELIRDVLLSAADHGRGVVGPDEIKEWYGAVVRVAGQHGFFFSEQTFIAVAERR